MNESSNGGKRFIAFIMIAMTIGGLWHAMRQSDAIAAIDETVDAFVPGPETYDGRLSHIEKARDVTNLINSRQSFPRNNTE